MNHDTLMELAALYALDALEGGELVDFEEHLDGCEACQAEVDSYRAVASQLVVDEPATDTTWGLIRDRIADSAEVVQLDPGRRDPADRPWKWVAAVAAVAALVLAGVLAVQLIAAPGLSDASVVAAAETAATEDGSIVGDFLVDGVPVAQVVLTEDGRGFVIPSDDLAALDETQTYQLWVINDSEEVISAGVLGAAPAPATFTWTGDISGFALTREVAGGVISSAGDVVSVITDV
ncbi:MAG TPA: anti-sigma factor [Acidimicrobiia bacterium]|nr:anti-sigma factor [Acidimicrobiia bacterium]